ncbi:MAG: GNAT family N-acetyltransferase [Sporolactobacillus sp.]
MKSIRKAEVKDLNAIYTMGYDVWGEGLNPTDYIELCRRSTKYPKGNWYLLEEKGNPLSSLIIYHLSVHLMGIGSVATSQDFRNQGNASILLKKIIKLYLTETTFCLYSDINPQLYARLGFKAVPECDQPYSDTILMYYPDWIHYTPEEYPKYF